MRLDVGGGAHVYYKRTSAVPAGADVSELIENATVTVGVGNQVRTSVGRPPHPPTPRRHRAPGTRSRGPAQMRTRRAPVHARCMRDGSQAPD